jgi:hypothetical protein
MNYTNKIFLSKNKEEKFEVLYIKEENLMS